MSITLLEKKLVMTDEFRTEISYEKLNVEIENEVIEYEKALYNAFMDRNPNNWLVNNYELIDNCRFRSKIPYKIKVFILLEKMIKLLLAYLLIIIWKEDYNWKK